MKRLFAMLLIMCVFLTSAVPVHAAEVTLEQKEQYLEEIGIPSDFLSRRTAEEIKTEYVHDKNPVDMLKPSFSIAGTSVSVNDGAFQDRAAASILVNYK